MSQEDRYPLAPGLVREWTEAGRWLFRWRSYLPLAVLAYLLLLEAATPDAGFMGRDAAAVLGLLIAASGLGLRAWAVGHVPAGTSSRGTREIGASTLNTDGLYSAVRHPLYLGNFLIWMGLAVQAAHVSGVLVSALVFWVYYERIMLAEERFLTEKFGVEFDTWSRRTPAFIPRLGGWERSPLSFSLRYALGRDYQAIYALVASATVIELVWSVAAGEGWLPRPFWLVFFGAGTVLYFLVDYLRRHTTVLSVEGR